MNTLFRLVFYITVLLMLFNLGWGLVRSLDGTVFSDVDDPWDSDVDRDSGESVMYALTGIESKDGTLFGVVLAGAGLVVGLFSLVTHNYTPIALYLFGVGFWASYNGTITAINLGGMIPFEFMILVHATMAFLFIGAIIGLITGNG